MIEYNCPRGIGKTNWAVNKFLNNWQKHNIKTFLFVRTEDERRRVCKSQYYDIPENLKQYVLNVQCVYVGLGIPEVSIYDDCEYVPHKNPVLGEIIKIYSAPDCIISFDREENVDKGSFIVTTGETE